MAPFRLCGRACGTPRLPGGSVPPVHLCVVSVHVMSSFREAAACLLSLGALGLILSPGAAGSPQSSPGERWPSWPPHLLRGRISLSGVPWAGRASGPSPHPLVGALPLGFWVLALQRDFLSR